MQHYKKFKIPFTNISFIRWNPNANTSIHYHPNKECNFMVLKGILHEDIYKEIGEGGFYMINSKILEKNQSSHINDKIGQHRIRNIYNNYVWSIHYYGKCI